MDPIFTQGESATWASYGAEWLVLLVPFLVLGAAVAALFALGTGRGFFGRVGDSLERVSGLPSWSAAGLGMGIFALAVAVIGFYWDVSWHIEEGRDDFIFTPAHMGILLGLTFIVVAGATSTLFATLQKSGAGLRIGHFSIPSGALCLFLLGIGALTGFPLDEFWHKAYGVDVTMWGPTHLVMISGASLTPLALQVLVAEGHKARPGHSVRQWITVILAGAMLTGLSTWTGEFDFGVPQFQQLYHPVLVVIAASIGLTIARSALGPGGAIKAALSFIVLRLGIVALLGGGLGILFPRFPLYLVAAVLVEVTARRWDRDRPMKPVIITGAAIGTLGLAAEWAWIQVWGWQPWGPSLFPGVLVAVLVAFPGVLLGRAMGEVLAGRARSFGRVPLVLAGLGIVAALAIPFPRNSAPIESVVNAQPAGEGLVDVTVELEPTDAAEPADWFNVTSWQGGSLRIADLEEVSPGTYKAEEPVPVSGDWKSFVRIGDKDVLVATPIFLPADPEIDASEIPVLERREESFRRDTEILLREATEGSSTTAFMADLAILALAGTWVAGLSYAFGKVARTEGSAQPMETSSQRVPPMTKAKVPV